MHPREPVHDNGPSRGRVAKCLSWYDLVGGRWWIRTTDPRRVKVFTPYPALPHCRPQYFVAPFLLAFFSIRMLRWATVDDGGIAELHP